MSLLLLFQSGAVAWPLYVGTGQADDVYVGTDQVDALYVGSTQIYP